MDGLEVTVSPGRVTAVLGPNGAGKSTILPSFGTARGRIGPRASADQSGGITTLPRSALFIHVCFLSL